MKRLVVSCTERPRLFPHPLVVYHSRKPFGRVCVLPPCMAMAAALRTYLAELLALPESSVQATPVQDLVRREDSEYLVGFEEKILLSSEEFRETVGCEGFARVHIDPALKRSERVQALHLEIGVIGYGETLFGFGVRVRNFFVFGKMEANC